MSSPLRTLLSAMVICLLLAWSPVARAAVPPALIKDFQPVTGHVVMPAAGQFLIDLDATQGVGVGDLFSVVQPGREIVDPATHKVLGHLDKVQGLLQVTQVRSGYSYARPLGKAAGIARGEQIRRYENMRAAFWDYTGRGEAFCSELQRALPHLQWQSYAAAQKGRPPMPGPSAKGGAQVIFVLTGKTLSVRDANFNLLHSYPAPPGTAPASAAPSASAAPPSVPAPSSTAAAEPIVRPPAPTPIVPAAKSASAKPAPVSPPPGIWKSPPMQGVPVGVAVGDFDGDGRQEIAVAFSDHLLISRVVAGRWQKLARVPLGDVHALGLDAFDLNGDGRPELYVTAVWGQSLTSLVVAHTAVGYRVVQKNIPWYFRRVDLPGQGPALLGQRMGADRKNFAGPIFRVRLVHGRVQAGTALSLPAKLRLYSFLPLPQGKGKPLFVTLTPADHLQVLSAEGKALWESSATFGGNETYFERPDSSAGGSGSGTHHVYLKARLALGPGGDVLVPANEGSRLFARFRDFSRSRLVALKWDGYTLDEAWHTWPQDGYLADFCLADAANDGHPELTMVIGFHTGGLFGGLFASSRSAIYLYKLP